MVNDIWPKMRLLIAALLCFQTAVAAPVDESDAESAGKGILVLDASGSMWGKVGGKTKIEIARDSIRQLVNAWNPDIELGLMAYGHRRKGDCSDIELVLPVTKHKPATVIDAVNRLNARGKTPLSSAVIQAADTLRYTTERATVILISDGLETCDLDPCQVAEELEQSGVAFTAHVIGFDLKKKETSALRCLADGTGGMFLEAVDAASLTTALTTVEESISAAAPAIKVPPASTLVAVLKSGMPPLQQREINWHVTDPTRGDDGQYKRVGFYRHTKPRIRIGSGQYRVLVQTSLVTRETVIDIDRDKPVEHQIDLQAGQLTLAGFNKKGGQQLERDVRWYLNQEEAKDSGKFIDLHYTNAASPTYVLPAGRYQLVLTSGVVRAPVVVNVKAGDIVEQNVYLNAGKVRLQGFLKQGGEPVRRVNWHVQAPEPESPGHWQEITYSSHNNPTFILGEGSYRIVAVANAARKEIAVDIAADQFLERNVSLDAGRVTLKAVDAESGQALPKVRWTITSPDPDGKGKYAKITYSSYHTPGFTLNEGRYRVAIEHNGKQSTGMIDVVSGEIKEVHMRVQPN